MSYLRNNSVMNFAGSPQVDEVLDDAPTRERVLSLILSQGPLTASELAEELGLTPTAIRRHLGTIVEAGLLTSREQRIYGPRGRGRPANVFVLTDTGRAYFHHDYDELAKQAITKLLEVGGDEAFDEFAEDWFAPVVADFNRQLDGDDTLSAAEALTTALTENGYVGSLTNRPSGLELCQHHCPVAFVAEEYPQLCEVETRVFSTLLNSHIQRLATIAHGDGVCTTHIPHPRTDTEKA